MIQFHYETLFVLEDEAKFQSWIESAISKMGKIAGAINYIFCDDAYLLKINQEYLQHDTYTDIISFDYLEGDILSGDIFISVERVKENAKTFQVSFEEELARVLIHGVLHFAGYKDKTESDKKEMRAQEEFYLKLYREGRE